MDELELGAALVEAAVPVGFGRGVRRNRREGRAGAGQRLEQVDPGAVAGTQLDAQRGRLASGSVAGLGQRQAQSQRTAHAGHRGLQRIDQRLPVGGQVEAVAQRIEQRLIGQHGFGAQFEGLAEGQLEALGVDQRDRRATRHRQAQRWEAALGAELQ